MLLLNKNKNLQKREIYLIDENIVYKKFKKPKLTLKLFYTKRSKKLF
jgi:hypothetical protein